MVISGPFGSDMDKVYFTQLKSKHIMFSIQYNTDGVNYTSNS